VKGCEFHYKLSIERKAKGLGDKADEFKHLALNMLNVSTPESYANAVKNVKTFSTNNGGILNDWIEWWDSRKDFIFRAFTTFNAPQCNQAEVVHAGWKHRDKMGVSLLECCYFDIRDSILLFTNINNLEKGGHASGYGSHESTRKNIQNVREIGHANQIGRDLLDFSISSSTSQPKRKCTSNEIEDGCIPPKKSRNTRKTFQKRLETAKNMENTTKVKTYKKVSELKYEFYILSSVSGRTSYQVTVCNVPSCSCPDFKKNGAHTACKHIIFVFLF
jgi:hypothetical protein